MGLNVFQNRYLRGFLDFNYDNINIDEIEVAGAVNIYRFVSIRMFLRLNSN